MLPQEYKKASTKTNLPHIEYVGAVLYSRWAFTPRIHTWGNLCHSEQVTSSVSSWRSRFVDLVAVGEVPVLAVHNDSREQSSTHFFGWHDGEGRWLQVAPTVQGSDSDLDPQLRTAGRVLLLLSGRGVFQLDPGSGAWREVGSIESLSYEAGLTVEGRRLWLTRHGRGIWRYRR